MQFYAGRREESSFRTHRRGWGMSVRRALATIGAALVALLTVHPAGAESRSPEECGGNGASSSFEVSKAWANLGETVYFRAEVSVSPGTCPVESGTLRVYLPGLDGQPSGTYQTITHGPIAAGGSFQSNPIPYTLASNPGVVSLSAHLQTQILL